MLGLKREGNVLERVLVKIQVVTLSEFCRIVKKVSKERKGKLSLGKIGENHGTCGETGEQHGRIPRYRGNGMYEKCSSELERPYPSPKGKEKAYKLGEIVFLMEGSRRGT